MQRLPRLLLGGMVLLAGARHAQVGQRVLDEVGAHVHEHRQRRHQPAELQQVLCVQGPERGEGDARRHTRACRTVRSLGVRWRRSTPPLVVQFGARGRWHPATRPAAGGAQLGLARPARPLQVAVGQRRRRKMAAGGRQIAEAVLVLKEEAGAAQLVEGLLEPCAAHVVALDHQEGLPA